MCLDPTSEGAHLHRLIRKPIQNAFRQTLLSSLYTYTLATYTHRYTKRLKSLPEMTIHDEAWPDGLNDQVAIELLKSYMQLSNASNPTHPDEASEESFAKLFTADGVYELGSKRAQGRSGMIASYHSQRFASIG